MRYWKVSLLREGRTAREWHVHAEVLTIGSNGANSVRLPPPVAPFALRLEDADPSQVHEAGPYLLRVEDETAERSRLWSQAQARIQEARAAFPEAPRDSHAPARMAAAAAALVGLTNLAATLLVDGGRRDLPATVGQSAPASVRARLAAAPQAPAVLVATASAPAARLACIVPACGVDGAGAASNPAIWAVLSALSFGIACSGGAWNSRPPSRYRAPWPDAPIPPH